MTTTMQPHRPEDAAESGADAPSSSVLTPAESSTWARAWCFYSRAQLTIDHELRRVAGVSQVELVVLSELNASFELTKISELAECMRLNISHISRVITRLDARGFIRRVNDPKDARTTFVGLTAEGIAVAQIAEATHSRLVNTALEGAEAKGLSPERLANVLRVMGDSLPTCNAGN